MSKVASNVTDRSAASIKVPLCDCAIFVVGKQALELVGSQVLEKYCINGLSNFAEIYSSHNMMGPVIVSASYDGLWRVIPDEVGHKNPIVDGDKIGI